MLNAFLVEQAEKQARLKQKRVGQAMHTREVAVQCGNSRQTSEAAVQTDIPDIMEDLKEQVKSLTKIVAELTELKATVNPDPLDNLALICQGRNCSDVISETPPQVPPSAVSPPLIVPETSVHRTVPVAGQNQPMPFPMKACPQPQLRLPLSTVDSNAQVLCSTLSLGPTDDQKRKVEALVLMGTQMVPSAMACVNVLFSDEELANGNTAGSNGYRPLDNLKLRFLASVLRHKYELPMFTEQWEDVKAKLNTRCRGKRRTVLRRLQRQINF